MNIEPENEKSNIHYKKIIDLKKSYFSKFSIFLYKLVSLFLFASIFFGIRYIFKSDEPYIIVIFFIIFGYFCIFNEKKKAYRKAVLKNLLQEYAEMYDDKISDEENLKITFKTTEMLETYERDIDI